MNLFIAAEASGPFGIILPATAELVYGVIAFAIVYVVLSKVAFPKVGQVLDDRAAAIQGKMEEADAKLAESEEAKQRYEASIADARGESNRIIEDGKATGESLRREIVERAEREAAQIVERAQNEVAVERDRALQELRAQVGTMSGELASRIVERELDADTHQALVDDYIGRLSSQN